jgi:hypothetical protein
MGHLGVRGVRCSLRPPALPRSFHLSAPLGVRGKGAWWLVLWIVCSKRRHDQHALYVGGQPDSCIHGVARPRGEPVATKML